MNCSFCLSHFVAALLVLIVSFGAEARERSHFYSQGRAQSIAVDSDLVALPSASAREIGWATSLSSSDRAQFSNLGVIVTESGRLHPGDDDGLAPVWFGDNDSTAGLLTRGIVVKVASNLLEESLGLIRNQTGFVSLERLNLAPAGWYTVRFESPVLALDAANALYSTDGIIYSHPDFRLQIDLRSAANIFNPEDEPLFSKQWNLRNVGQSGGTPGADLKIADAWKFTLGEPSTIVAIIDVGVEQSHPDLKDAWFVNTREIPGNKKDDDGNGLIDDVSGWNFSTDGNNLLYGRSNKHGTATAGILGARLNGIGIVGGCPRCTILPIVVDGEPSRDAKTFWYAKSMGASVISNSWGYVLQSPKTDVVVEAINDTAANGRGGKGTSIIFAMSNGDKNDCRSSNPDISSTPSVIAVSSVDHNDRKVEMSGYGECLAFVGPSAVTNSNAIVTTDRVGVNGYNTAGTAPDLADPDYTNTFYGTSAAAPGVSSVFALLYSIHPDWTAAQAYDVIKRTVDKVSPADANYDPATGRSLHYGFGRPNAAAALGWGR